MEITTRTININTIKPTPGMYLTQASLENKHERSFVDDWVQLAPTMSPDEWIEVDEEYKNAWEQSQLTNNDNEQA